MFHLFLKTGLFICVFYQIGIQNKHILKTI